MKATDLLKKQHKSVKALFKKVDKTEDGRQRRQLMGQIANELKLHTKIEEEKEMFPMCEKKLGRARLEELGQKMQRMVEGSQRRAA